MSSMARPASAPRRWAAMGRWSTTSSSATPPARCSSATPRHRQRRARWRSRPTSQTAHPRRLESPQDAGTLAAAGGETAAFAASFFVSSPFADTGDELVAICESRCCTGAAEGVWIAAVATTRPKAKAKKVSCETCYFKCNLLCALSVAEPCVTSRPDAPDGLRPPQQMRLNFRDDTLTRPAFAFRSAQEQAALHA